MDDILALYTEALPEGHEVHCFDETPKQLLSTPRGGSACAAGKYRRLDYEYKRLGRVNLFVASAPFKGERTVVITTRRTLRDTAAFLWSYCMETHRGAGHIHLVLDNLNTHKEQALRRHFGAQKSVGFFQRVTFHFTPPHASWLNLAELEINCLKRQGLRRRIATEAEMRYIADTIVKERNARSAIIRWGFTKAKAREKFPVLYSTN